MEPIVIARAPGHLTFGCNHNPTGEPAADLGFPVVTAAVNYYAYAIISSSHIGCSQIIFSGHRTVPWHLLDDGLGWGESLTIPNAIAELFNVHDGLTVFLSTQAPHGIGLGLPGSLTISMIKALAYSCGLDLEPMEVADLAHHVRTDTLRLPDDSLGQYAAACGGLNNIDVVSKRLKVEPLRVSPEIRRSLEKQLMLFLSEPLSCLPGKPHIDREPRLSPAGQSEASWKAMSRHISRHICYALEEGDLATFGDLLHQAWQQQAQNTRGKESSILGQSYSIARECGALGGQRVKAYNCSSLLLICPEKHQPGVSEALTALGLKQWPIALEDDGVQVMEATPHTRFISSTYARETPHFSDRLFSRQ